MTQMFRDTTVPETQPPVSSQGVQYTGSTATSKGGVLFKYNSNVAKWRAMIREVRASMGISEETYPDALVLAFIHTESAGDPDARRTNKDGKLADFCGLLQVGTKNAADGGYKNTDFVGNPRLSIQHFFEYQETYTVSFPC